MVEVGVWMGVGCLYAPVLNNFVTPCYMREEEREKIEKRTNKQRDTEPTDETRT